MEDPVDPSDSFIRFLAARPRRGLPCGFCFYHHKLRFCRFFFGLCTARVTKVSLQGEEDGRAPFSPPLRGRPRLFATDLFCLFGYQTTNNRAVLWSSWRSFRSRPRRLAARFGSSTRCWAKCEKSGLKWKRDGALSCEFGDQKAAGKTSRNSPMSGELLGQVGKKPLVGRRKTSEIGDCSSEMD
ncbi:hypothetical protein HPP92_002939 [Vanilla planifolia]|uniref:Uncharacterized protein n=1 Tax=Vanilla planifolia TaxID=51239 RepID=A0A835RZQ3_VANPL|nr:hypothetical protein HPP92_003305 [Vanilla planifolia]KAG0502867.1 hypothetical protein HPP92_002939 [Vanilla planifolia]